MGVKVRQKVKGKGQPWWVFISHNGKRTSRKIGDRRSAETVARTIEAKLALGEFGFDEKEKPALTFEAYSKKFMMEYSNMQHKPNTQVSYRDVLDNHLLPQFGSVAICEISPEMINAFLNEKLASSKLATNTVRLMKSYLSSILEEAQDTGLIETNPAKNLGRRFRKKLIPKKNSEDDGIDPLTKGELKSLLDTVKMHFSDHYFFRYYPTSVQESQIENGTAAGFTDR